jgi:hypothetical protein
MRIRRFSGLIHPFATQHSALDRDLEEQRRIGLERVLAQDHQISKLAGFDRAFDVLLK